jgi:hypothetical protein
MERIHRLSPLFKNKLKFIVNDGVPACVNCMNLINIDNTPVCKLFGVYDMVHGTTTYLNATNVEPKINYAIQAVYSLVGRRVFHLVKTKILSLRTNNI